MQWTHYLWFFFGGAFLTNAVPHAVSGLIGRPFQTPFAKPPGQGLSSSTVNLLWGFFNLAAGYIFMMIGDFDLRAPDQTAVAALGALLIALLSARLLGRFHGGNMPGIS
jgi:drug/metabolite transporter (DMT)-like permease